MKLGELLAYYQKEKKLTLRQFAKEVGVDHTTLWRVMKSRDNGENTKQWPTILRWLFGK